MSLKLTNCLGRGCELAHKCARFTTDISKERFSDEPFVIIDGKFNCPMYWGEEQIRIFDQLIEASNEPSQ